LRSPANKSKEHLNKELLAKKPPDED